MIPQNPSKWSTLCVLILLVSIADVTLAGNSLCINADNILNQVYIDGIDVTTQLVNRASVRDCDCIPLPANTQTIAVKAMNLGAEAGLQACRSANEAVYDGWRCRDAAKVSGTNWFSPDYSMASWRPAKTTTYPRKRSCRHWRLLSCQTHLREWFWAVTQIKNVVCRIDYCSPSCWGCKSAGAGRCDRDKCTLGAGTDNDTVVLDAGGFVTCQRKCCVNIKATNQTETPNGYIEVIDRETGAVDRWEANVAGRYLATIDLKTCTTTRRNYTDWDHADDRTTDTLNRWKSSVFSPELKNMYGIDLAVGDGTGSYAPWIDVWRLGVDDATSLYGADGYSTSFQICLQGINNGDVVSSEVVGPTYIPSS